MWLGKISGDLGLLGCCVESRMEYQRKNGSEVISGKGYGVCVTVGEDIGKEKGKERKEEEEEAMIDI